MATAPAVRDLMLALLCAGLVTGCGGRRGAAPSARVWAEGSTVRIEVENRHYLDATIFVEAPGRRPQRIGLAIASRSTELRFAPRHLGSGGEVRLIADAVGATGARLASEPLVVRPGQRIVWTIERSFQASSAAVW